MASYSEVVRRLEEKTKEVERIEAENQRLKKLWVTATERARGALNALDEARESAKKDKLKALNEIVTLEADLLELNGRWIEDFNWLTGKYNTLCALGRIAVRTHTEGEDASPAIRALEVFLLEQKNEDCGNHRDRA